MAEDFVVGGEPMIATDQVGRMHYVVARLEAYHRAELLDHIRQIVREEIRDAGIRGENPG